MGTHDETAATIPSTRPAIAVPDVLFPMFLSLMLVPFPWRPTRLRSNEPIIGERRVDFISSELMKGSGPRMPGGQLPERKTGLGAADWAQNSGVRSIRGIYLCNLALRAMKTRIDCAI